MAYPMKTCSVCGEEFELRPDKPGFANHCPSCTEEQLAKAAEESGESKSGKADSELNAARREAMRNLLYHKDS
jgi:hypothetical protein